MVLFMNKTSVRVEFECGSAEMENKLSSPAAVLCTKHQLGLLLILESRWVI